MAKILLHDAEGLVVVAKPAGWPSTGHTLDDPESVRFQVQEALQRKIWAVHQLDKPTSGVFLMVRKKSLVSIWQKNLSKGQKTYWAICEGRPKWKGRRLQSSIGYDIEAKKVVEGDHGKSADTTFRVLSSGNRLSAIEARPRTGRTHQIRVHLAATGHPIIGDHLYGDISLAPRAMLHCARIRAGGRTFDAPVPDDFTAACEADALQCPGVGDRPGEEKAAP